MMSQPEGKTGAGALGEARIAGRVHAVRSRKSAHGTMFLTLMKLPAASVYESPGTVEVRSEERLGAVGDELALRVRVGGYYKSYARSEENGGGRVETAENTLVFVGHA